LPVASRTELPVVGSWRLTRLIQRGTRTSLFRARPREANDGPGCYVVKTADGRDETSHISRAMLAREAALGASVNHPNVAAVLSASLRGDAPYLVRPYLEGLTLRQLLSLHEGPIAVTTALWIARQIAEALTALHQAGWLHSQVRPEHVIVSPHGQATLFDLSLARRLRTEECAAGHWQPQSAAYVSPEMLSASAGLTTASDTYCLGLLLYELLAGRPPLASADSGRLAAMHRTHAPPDIRAARVDVPPELSQLLRLMLAKQPLRRPANEELVRWLTDLEIAALL
jgi:serine/threonine-protein kinase